MATRATGERHMNKLGPRDWDWYQDELDKSDLKWDMGVPNLTDKQLRIIRNLAVAAQSHFDSVDKKALAHHTGLLLGVVETELKHRQ
tara:strand:+ start:682 stop:942 length:261 start_codon:yes stop_codon:yes gene_type:complete